MLIDDLRTLVRIPSVTGSEEAVSERLLEMLGMIPGMAVGLMNEDPATIRADPDWPGEEMPRSTLPIVIGRFGRPARPTDRARRAHRRRPGRRPRDLDGRPVGRRDPRRRSCTVAAPAT